MTTTTYEKLRTVEHTFENGSQSVIEVIKMAVPFKDKMSHTLILAKQDGDRESILIHSRDQLDRLIATLKNVADNHFDDVDAEWPERTYD